MPILNYCLFNALFNQGIKKKNALSDKGIKQKEISSIGRASVLHTAG